MSVLKDCVLIENKSLSLLVARSIGPRILSLRLRGGENLFAELPHFTTRRPDGEIYHFHGGHRLWVAPEDPIRSYSLDDEAVEILPGQEGLLIGKAVEPETGIEKSMHVRLVQDEPEVVITHRLTNRGEGKLTCAPWAITQFKTGGVALLPQSREKTDLVPNRALALWPYTDIACPQVCWGNDCICVHAGMRSPFKIGFPNPRGWLGYWLDGTLFVKRAAHIPGGEYVDYGSSSECYCNDQFVEIETLGPLETLAPGAYATHIETWHLYAGVPYPRNETVAREIIERFELG